MRKFKHKITGDIVIETVCKGNRYYSNGPHDIPAVFVENSNDWQEIIEKDYEILAFSFENRIDYKVCTGLFKFKGAISNGWPEESYKNWQIHSIKRLSDNEIFTIGDKTNNGTISKFENCSVGIRVFFKEKPENYHVNLNTIKKVIYLFTTHDGVDIYEYDFVHWVAFCKDKTPYYLYKSDFVKGHLELDLVNTYKIFSTKQAAEEYLAKNKVLFVTDDGVILHKGDICYHVYRFNVEDNWGNYNKIEVGNFSRLDANIHKYFSTEAKAKEFIDLNKPQYSKQDVINMFNSSVYQEPYFRDTLKLLKHN